MYNLEGGIPKAIIMRELIRLKSKVNLFNSFLFFSLGLFSFYCIAQPNALKANLDFADGTLNGWTITGNGPAVIQQVAIQDTFGQYSVLPPVGKYSLRLGSWVPKDTFYVPTWVYQHVTAANTFIVDSMNPWLVVQNAFDLLKYNHTHTQAAFVQWEFLNAKGDTIYKGKYLEDTDGSSTQGIMLSQHNGISGQWPKSNNHLLKNVDYKPWFATPVNLTKYVGQQVTFKITNSYCIFNVDWIYSYLNVYCAHDSVYHITEDTTNCRTQLCGPPKLTHYSWAKDNQPLSDTTQCIILDSIGTYSLTFSGASQHPITIYRTVNQLNAPPVVNFTSHQMDFCQPIINFAVLDSLKFPVGTNVIWDFGDSVKFLSTHFVSNHTYNFKDSAAFIVKLSLVLPSGCNTTQVKKVQVYDNIIPKPYLDICHVMVNESSTHNAVTWSSQNGYLGMDSILDSVIVFRLNDYNVKQQLGIVPFGHGYFMDTAFDVSGNGNPNLGSNQYQIAIKYHCGQIVPLGSVHSSLFLSHQGGNFTWTPYKIAGKDSTVVNQYTLLVDSLSNGNWKDKVTLPRKTTNYVVNDFSQYTNASWKVLADINTNCSSIEYIDNPKGQFADYSRSNQVAFKDLIPCKGFAVSISSPDKLGVCNGTASAIILGGTAPFGYSWSTGFNTPSVNNICPGMYALQVVDAYGCLAKTIANISADTAVSAATLSVNVNTTYASSPNACNGFASAYATGGVSPYKFQFSNKSSYLNNDSLLCAGIYQVTVTDIKGTICTNTFVISTPTTTFQDSSAQYADSVGIATVNGAAQSNCVINYPTIDSANIVGYALVGSGTDTILVNWALFDGKSQSMVGVKYAIAGSGVYTFVLQIYCGPAITSKMVASGSSTYYMAKEKYYININQPTGILDAAPNFRPSHIYPVPFTNKLNIQFGSNGDSYMVTIVDITGKMVSNSPSVSGQSVQTLNLCSLDNGIYFVKVQSIQTGRSEFFKAVKN